jgi:hypothetical protein
MLLSRAEILALHLEEDERIFLSKSFSRHLLKDLSRY